MMTKHVIGCLVLGAAITSLAGCTFYARDQKDYRDATTKLLETKSGDIDTCYDAALKATPGVKGKVTVQFNLEEKTGKVVDVKADPARTDAPQALVDCVTTNITGLVLDPADQRKGLATFEYKFEQKQAKK
jgi:hypothetical protein